MRPAGGAGQVIMTCRRGLCRRACRSGAGANLEPAAATGALEALAPCRGDKDQVLESAHPPAGKLTSTAVSAGVLAATLGAMAASVAAGGGRLEYVWRRACRAVKMELKGMASA